MSGNESVDAQPGRYLEGLWKLTQDYASPPVI